MRDTYALALTGWSEREALAMADSARSVLPSMYTTWICRGRFTEDRLAVARARGVDQYIVLGAGLDSFALRHADSLGAICARRDEQQQPLTRKGCVWRGIYHGLAFRCTE